LHNNASCTKSREAAQKLSGARWPGDLLLTQPPLDFLDRHFLRQVLWHPIAHPLDGHSHFSADRSVGVDRRLLTVESFASLSGKHEGDGSRQGREDGSRGLLSQSARLLHHPQSPAMKNGRCRMHGGPSPGAPKGNRNALKHGRYTADAIENRRDIAALLRSMKTLGRGGK
jgi:hypothetical protein